MTIDERFDKDIKREEPVQQELIQGQTVAQVLRNPHTDAVVQEWLAFVRHSDHCDACKRFAILFRRYNRYNPNDVEMCCGVGQGLVLAWRGACDELKQHSGFARKVARK